MGSRTGSRIAFVSLLLALIAAAPRAAPADVIYSNFGPGDSYDTTSEGLLVGTYYGAVWRAVAVSFEVPAGRDYRFDGYDFAGYDGALQPDEYSGYFVARLYPGGVSDFTAQFDTPPLEEWDATVDVYPGGIAHLPSGFRPVLKAGATYWLTFFPLHGTDSYLFLSNQSTRPCLIGDQDFVPDTFYPDDLYWLQGDSGTPVCRVYGTPVPEPAFYQLGTLLALGGLGLLRRRRRA